MIDAGARVSDLDVVFLCGGRGRRLQPLTDLVPKPMVPFLGKPMLDHIVDLQASKGLSRFTFCLGYKGEVIRDHYAKGMPGCRLAFSVEDESASMLRRLNSVCGQVGERFLCVYGDTFIDLDLQSMLHNHVARQAGLTMVTTKVRNPFGLVREDAEGWVTGFEEKPLFTYYVGCFVAERSVFTDVEPDLLDMPDGQGLVALFERLAARRQLSTFEHSGLQLSFNTVTEKQQVEEELGKFYTIAEER